ncbi:hypothetical protein AXG93_3410s1110 [Marchantia polymorpha subsp. ruderalis]|uniref:Uncharacterized protein n=1 Tax=Marchantia polymorpha subsp. ruderalis TaxID=1480154 RepID=A0A176W4W8_MARPO|nr:hypothetical protein AXG93_3410s1110 [Marchantia polymorpha subsp. ruderalis]
MDKSTIEGEELRGSRWTGPLTNHITPFLVNFYRGMGLLTRKEEKRFPTEREILTAESSEGTEDENRPPSIPTQTTARASVQVDVVQRREKPKRRLAKRRKVVSGDEEELAHEKISAELLTRLKKSRESYNEAVKRLERLIITAEKREKKHVEELAKLGKADMRSQELQQRMQKAEETYRQLRDKSTDELKLRLEKCLNGFAMWRLQTVKWLKLDSLKRRLMNAKTSGSAGHK